MVNERVAKKLKGVFSILRGSARSNITNSERDEDYIELNKKYTVHCDLAVESQDGDDSSGESTPDGHDENPVNVVIAVDTSASMAVPVSRYYRPEAIVEGIVPMRKFQLVQEFVPSFYDGLAASDRFGLLTFNDKLDWLVPMASRNAISSDTLQQSLHGLEPGGGTRLDDALSSAFDALGRLPGTASESRVFLLTDGRLPLVDSSEGCLLDRLSTQAQSEIYTTIGLVSTTPASDALAELATVPGAECLRLSQPR